MSYPANFPEQSNNVYELEDNEAIYGEYVYGDGPELRNYYGQINAAKKTAPLEERRAVYNESVNNEHIYGESVYRQTAKRPPLPAPRKHVGLYHEYTVPDEELHEELPEPVTPWSGYLTPKKSGFWSQLKVLCPSHCTKRKKAANQYDMNELYVNTQKSDEIKKKIDKLQKELDETEQKTRVEEEKIYISVQKVHRERNLREKKIGQLYTSTTDFFHLKKNGKWDPDPELLWIDENKVFSFGRFSSDALVTSLTCDNHARINIGQTYCATFRYNGHYATGHEDGTVSSWSNDTRIGHKKVHQARVWKVCTLPAERLLTTSADGSVKMIYHNGQIINEMEGLKGQTSSIASYQYYVATGGNEGRIKFYDIHSGHRPKDLIGHSPTSDINSLEFKETVLLSCSSDGTSRLWKPTKSHRSVFTMDHGDIVTSAKFGVSHTDQNLLTCSWDKTCKIWSLDTGHEVRSIDHTTKVYCLDIDSVGTILATGHDEGVTLVDSRSAEVIKTLDGSLGNPTWDVKFSPNGLHLASTEKKGAVKITDLRYTDKYVPIYN